MKKLKFYICKIKYFAYKTLGMSLDLSIIDNEISDRISKEKYNKYNLPLDIKSIIQKDSGDIEIVLEYPPQEIITIVLSLSQKEIEISGVDSKIKNQLDLVRTCDVIQKIIDDLNYTPSEKFRDLKRKSFTGRTKGR